MSKQSHADIVFAYFKIEKEAREYGFRMAVNWSEGVFRLYYKDECLDSTRDIFDMRDVLSLHVESRKKILGLD